MSSYDLVAHLYRQRAFSRATFGPGAHTKGVIDHIRKELIEIEAEPRDLTEWVDVILLAFDGLWRCAQERDIPIEVAVGAIAIKQDRNERRDWPDWRGADPDKAIEHIDLSRRAVVTNTPRAGETPAQSHARTAEARAAAREPGCMATVREIAQFAVDKYAAARFGDEGGGP